MSQIDINSDMGEMADAIADGTQESLMPSITSVNIACGGHAGDEQTMRATIQQALRWHRAIGAHPGYPDRANFGRIALNMVVGEVEQTVFEQVRALGVVAQSLHAALVHVKPHGMLYNQAVSNPALARAIADGVARYSTALVLVGLAGSEMLDVFRDAGFAVAAESFADRRYEGDGTLRSRKFEDALIRDPAQAADQAARIVEKGSVLAANGSSVRIEAQTICIHSDTPGAPAIAQAVFHKLSENRVRIEPLRLSHPDGSLEV
jgi:5-oxoprolinase (ATP-hydrolysing) subunit A